MRIKTEVIRAAVIGLIGLVATASQAVLATDSSFAAWKGAHPNVDAQIADLKAKTAAMIKTAAPFPAIPKYADIAVRSAALSPQQKDQARQFFADGFSRLQTSDFVGAKKIVTKGLEIDPANSIGNFYMGDLLYRQGDMNGAALSMDRAKTLAPDTREGIKAAAILSGLPAPAAEDPSVDKPPVIWRVPGAINEVWDSADAPEMVVIPAGEYTMGSPASEPGRDDSESPRHRVRIAYPLAVGKYPITVGQFAKFIAESGYSAPDRCDTFINGSFLVGYKEGWNHPGFSQGKDSPVVCINWLDAKAYAAWLSKKTGHTYRLLSESEYEYVTRAGTTTTYWWGDAAAACGFVNSADLDAKATPQLGYWDVSNCHDGHAFTAPTNSFKPNPFGLYDISGNSLSFVLDCWTDSYKGVPNDGSAYYDDKCVEPVIRGGSWADKASTLRTAYRNWNHDWIRFSTNGFRVARTL